ncbi:B3 domain-containing protein [Dendrobium catenatum]|uniref:B3 domain-containing protein n=2 Tax=Dendrobium catenatum TaxID=906689 RepID=A0A2I0VCB0_9ASPA|nr:B3 domain-containing protein [Dendrobium catenatum]
MPFLVFFIMFQVLLKKFIDHFQGELLETIELKVPSGDKWHVEMKKTGDGVVLDCGWTNFVAAYSILENDTLVFKYDGRSSFIVLMFEQSGCEKAASHCAMRKDGMEELCAIASGKKDRHPCYESSPKTYEQPKKLAMFKKILRANRDAKEKYLKRRMNTTSTKIILR